MRTKHASDGAAVTDAAALAAFAAQPTLKGKFALIRITEKVTAELVVRETGPLARELLITFTDKSTGLPITQFDEELTQQLHVLATDSDFSSFVHEHAGKAGVDGRFRVAMRFPKPATYHVYADAVPAGRGQQVFRFEVAVDVTTGPTAPRPAPVGRAQGSDGPYMIEMDAAVLRAGTDSMMALTILKDGKPAMDLGLFLGVPAHAVFVSTDDLGYVHAHAMAANTPVDSRTSLASHDNPRAAIPAKLMLHATPPRAGQYALWIQFMGGGQVRTVPFVINVAASS